LSEMGPERIEASLELTGSAVSGPLGGSVPFPVSETHAGPVSGYSNRSRKALEKVL
jgi:hypothetical protein